MGTKREPPKARELRKRDFIKPMMQCAGHQPNNYPTKHARFKRLNTQRHALPYGARVLMRQFSGQDQQRIDSGIHHQISEQRRQPCRAFIIFRQPNGDPNSKQYRQVCKHNRACAAHDGKDGL